MLLIEEVAALTPVEQGPSLLAGDVMANVKKKFDDESSKLKISGYEVTADRQEMDGDNIFVQQTTSIPQADP